MGFLPRLSEQSGSVLRLSIGFFMVFCAFNTTQALETTVLTDKQLAFATLCAIYAVFTTMTIVSPKIVSVLGPRLSMALGAVPYVLLVFANISPMWGTLLPASAGVGLGAAVLWTGQVRAGWGADGGGGGWG